MEMPTVQEQHKKLQALAGTWAGEEKIHPSPWDPKGGGATSKSQARIDLDGFHLISDYVQERDGKVCYRGHGVFGWDPAQKKYTMHWFDSMGMHSGEPALGTWEGKKLTFQQKSPMGHARYTYTFESEGRHTFTIENSQDGKSWATFMEGRYNKR
jgi:uncharacterized protein DUF1579